MTLLDLIRKPVSRKHATAIPAIPAIPRVQRAATVARIATVAVANAREANAGADAGPVRQPQPSRTVPSIASDPSDLINDYIERIAICSEAGDVAEDDAHRIAIEQCGATLDELAARQVAYWRQRIEALPEPTDRRLSNVRRIALDHLAQPWTHQAAKFGWTAAELFGLHRAAADVRVDAMGLVSSLALSKLRPPLQVVDITSVAATVSTRSGAVLTHFRLRPNLGPPVWEHPAFERPMQNLRET